LSARKPRIAILFAQFSAYHIDRCEAVAQRLADQAEVLAVEVATTSALYPWDPSGKVPGANKITLFPSLSFDSVGKLRRFWAQLRALWRCDWVFIGVGYNEPDIILLSWVLRLLGVRVVVLSESKFDDFPRNVWFEASKALLLAPYVGAIVGAQRQIAYFRFLGFRGRPVLPGYDTVGVQRLRTMGAKNGASTAWADRHFLFVGRFVTKKNLFELLDGYAAYRAQGGTNLRRLVLAGGGPDEAALRAYVAELGLSEAVGFPGFLGPEDVARLMARSLALVLPSNEEQWGLVVNEALAFGLPVIVSNAVGSRDLLVRNLINGYVVEPGAVDGLAAAMQALAADPAAWQAMSDASHERAGLGDTARLADAVESLITTNSAAQHRIEALVRTMSGPQVDDRLRLPEG
jgi:L-malate glycosyltransferase